MKNTVIPAIVGAIVLFFLTACATTQFTGVWLDENYHGGPIKSIMIVGVAENQRNRNIFESAMVKAFTAQGVRAIPSLETLGDKVISKETVVTAAKESDVQAVLITRLVGVNEEQVYYPPEVYTVPDPYYYRWDTYYPHMYEFVENPGYVQTYKYVNLETNIFDRDERQLIWSAASETFNPQDANKVVDDLAKLLIKELKRSKLI
jgi:hypothetical protein